jgi:hypothetical protein
VASSAGLCENNQHGEATSLTYATTPRSTAKGLFNLRTDPYERADLTSNTYYDWILDHAYLFIPAQTFVAQMLQTFAEFPVRQKPASFSLERVMEKLRAGIASA